MTATGLPIVEDGQLMRALAQPQPCICTLHDMARQSLTSIVSEKDYRLCTYGVCEFGCLLQCCCLRQWVAGNVVHHSQSRMLGTVLPQIQCF